MLHSHPWYDHHSVSFDLFGPECSIIYGGSYVPTLSNILPRPSFLHFSAKRKMLENVNSWEEYLHNITKHKFTKEAYLNTGKTGVFTSGQNSDIVQVQEYKEIKAYHIDPEALFEWISVHQNLNSCTAHNTVISTDCENIYTRVSACVLSFSQPRKVFCWKLVCKSRQTNFSGNFQKIC